MKLLLLFLCWPVIIVSATGLDLLETLLPKVPTEEMAWIVCSCLLVLTVSVQFEVHLPEMVARCSQGAGRHFEGAHRGAPDTYRIVCLPDTRHSCQA